MSALSYWGAGLLFLTVGTHLDMPYFALFRMPVALGLFAIAAAVLWRLVCTGRSVLLIGLWGLAAIAPPAHAWSALLQKIAVLRAPEEAGTLAPHFIVGFERWEDVSQLVERGLIGGIFVTRRNLDAGDGERFLRNIAKLQAIRRRRGEPPLIVATDQEGGVVSRLSPPVTARPPLSSLAPLHPAARAIAAHAYGHDTGRELAALGVNVNLAPVVDLRPSHPRSPLDLHSRIDRRAIADDPSVVHAVALHYVRGLRQAGVWATLKHFPGLGQVSTDTHHLPAHILTSRQSLEQTDWRPFRDTLTQAEALTMVGHVTLDGIDPARPASLSREVIDGVLRRGWGYEGVVITDDLTMGPIYWRGLCRSVVEAFNAGADLLLVAYDTAMVTRAIYCAMEGLTEGRINIAILSRSRARLERLAAELPAVQTNRRSGAPVLPD